MIRKWNFWKKISWLILAGGFLVLNSHVFYAASNDDMLSVADSQYQKVLVKRIIKADTIILDTDEKIRLIGLKAPDAPQLKRELDEDKNDYLVIKDSPTNPELSIEEQAFDFARSFLEGKYVRLEFDQRRKNDDFVTCAYVFLVDDNTFVNAEIIRQGFADLQLRPPNMKYVERLREAYREAHREKRGLQSDD